MTKQVKSFFNKESMKGKYIYARARSFLEYYNWEIKIINKYLCKNIFFLDVGCGAGLFLKTVGEIFTEYNICGLDISENMIKVSRKNLDKKIMLCQGSAIDLPYKSNIFDLIYCEFLIHHLVSTTRSNSKILAKKTINNIKQNIKYNGFFLLKEWFYESYIFPELSSKLIFFLLNLLNKLGITLPLKEFSKGLIVSFYTRDELETIIKSLNGEIIEEKKIDVDVGIKEKIFLMKKKGTISYLIKFNN